MSFHFEESPVGYHGRLCFASRFKVGRTSPAAGLDEGALRVVELGAGGQRRVTRRRCTEEQKLAVVREAIETGNCAVVGRRHGIAENLVSLGTRQFRALGESAFTRPADGGSEEVRAYRALAFENERLKRLLGEKELEIAVLKDFVKKTTRK